MKNIFAVFFLLLFVSFHMLAQQRSNSIISPIYSYYTNGDSLSAKGIIGDYRILNLEERKGINTTSIHSRIIIPKHNLNEAKGTVTVWFFTLEDLATYADLPRMKQNNPHYRYIPILSDEKNPQNYLESSFFMGWINDWHGGFITKYYTKHLYDHAYVDTAEYKMSLLTNHFHFEKHKWYQAILTWENETMEHKIYINGILVATENQYKFVEYLKDQCGDTIYAGNPSVCLSGLKFYDKKFSNSDAYSTFRNEVTKYDSNLEEEIRQTHSGSIVKPFNWQPDSNWNLELSLPLTRKEDIENFYIQGYSEKTRISDEGLVLETPLMGPALTDSQVYAWTKRPFEGDLYMEFDFKTLIPGGLGLIVVQASGMSREDFMKDYPWRTVGRMSMIYGEDVRNYHWEYYREVCDIRHDVASGGIIKNPFKHPFAYGTFEKPLEKGRWYKLQFLQQGNKIIGAIDGRIIVEGEDSSTTNQGPVLNFGRIALRCMLNSKMVFRNLNIYNKKPPFEIIRNSNEI